MEQTQRKTYLGVIKLLKIKDKVVILKAAAGGKKQSDLYQEIDI